ncbi:MAG: hypothetical protein R6X02_30255 [Enhygromyxa sp.]
MWPSIVVALLIALLFTLPIVWLLGWRRPGASTEESAVLSGLFLFALVFLATWALGGWLAPWGPAYAGVPWLLALIVASFVALLVLVASPVSNYSPSGGATAQATRAAEGIGLIFWVLIVLLLVVGVVGNTRVTT